MRWPFAPPHLTLKPSKKIKNKKQKTKIEKKGTNKQKTKNTQKWAFQLSVKIFFFGWVSKTSFFDNLAQKVRPPPPKHYKNRVSANFFWRRHMLHETAIFGPKIPKSRISSYHCFAYFLLSFNNKQKTQKVAETPNFIVFLQPKKSKFSKFKLKTRKIEKPNFSAFLLKMAILRKLQDNWAQEKHKMIIEQQNKSPETPMCIVRKQSWTR